MSANFEPGTVVDVLPESDGTNFAQPHGWTVVGPTRHPYAVVLREPDHGTTVHVAVDRLVAVTR